MRRNTSILVVVGVVFSSLIMSFPAGATHDENDCVVTVTSPKQGRNSKAYPGVDGVLWPPNHKLRAISISAVNSHGNPCNVTITDVTQDEAVDAPGSGNTSPDATNCSNAGNTSSVSLRGERSGITHTGDTATQGRFYHVEYTTDDPDVSNSPDNNDPKAGTAVILTPHDQSPKKVWVDNHPPGFPSMVPFTCP